MHNNKYSLPPNPSIDKGVTAFSCSFESDIRTQKEASEVHSSKSRHSCSRLGCQRMLLEKCTGSSLIPGGKCLSKFATVFGRTTPCDFDSAAEHPAGKPRKGAAKRVGILKMQTGNGHIMTHKEQGIRAHKSSQALKAFHQRNNKCICCCQCVKMDGPCRGVLVRRAARPLGIWSFDRRRCSQVTTLSLQ